MRINVWTLCLVASLAFAATANAQPGGGRGMFGRGGGGIFMIVGNESVQKELGLSADEITKVKAVTDEFSASIRESMSGLGGANFQDMTQEERDKMREKMTEAGKTANEKFLPKLKEVLTADQFVRAQQINWQAMGAAAFSDAEVIKAIPISTEQQGKIKTVNSDFDAKQRELFAGGGFGGGGGGREKMQELGKERETKVKEVLTKDQLDKFAALTGKPFDVSELRPQGRGPGGGGGGGGGKGKRPQPKAE